MLIQRVCVSECPSQYDNELLCNPNKQVPACDSVPLYETFYTFERLGGFCAPVDEQEQKQLL